MIDLTGIGSMFIKVFAVTAMALIGYKFIMDSYAQIKKPAKTNNNAQTIIVIPKEPTK